MRLSGKILVAGMILLWIIFSPIWVPFLAFVYVCEGIEKFKFRRFLRKVEGARYFCYTTKQSSEMYVKNNILPFLPSDVQVLHITTKMFNLGDDEGFPYRIVAEMKSQQKGFPYIAKVVKGRLVTESINHELYRAIVTKRDADVINDKIQKFFA